MIFNVFSHPIFSYLYRYKIKIVFLFFSILVVTVMSGLSISMTVPLIDKVFVQKERSFHIFSEKKENFLFKNSVFEKKEGRLRSFVNRSVSQFSRKNILYGISIFLIIIFFIKGLFLFFENYLMEKISHLVVRDVRNALYRQIFSLSLDYFYQRKTGDLINLVSNDTFLLHNIVSSFSNLIFYFAHIVMYSLTALWLNWSLAIFSFIFIPLLILPILYVSSKVRKISLRSQEKVGDMISFLQERLMGVKEIKIFSTEQEEVQNFSKETEQSYKIIMKCMTQQSFLSPLMEVILGISMAFFLIVMGLKVLDGHFTTGEFMLFVIVTISLLRPFKKLAVFYSELQHSLASADRIFELFHNRSSIVEKEKAISIESFKEKIVYDNVCVSYSKNRPVLKNISFCVKKGESVALVGQMGCGKTSLLNLFPRFYDPKEGAILIDGVDIRQYSLKSLRSLVSFVSQDIFLFRDTVHANIAYGVDDKKRERVEEVARLANAHDFIKKLPQGYDTLIGERGVTLSGGQKQCLAIARALFRNTEILILDEATSSLDSETEFAIRQSLKYLFHGRTVLIVAHRLTSIHNADRILVVANKTIHAQGTHRELLQNNEFYRNLYNRQFADQDNEKKN